MTSTNFDYSNYIVPVNIIAADVLLWRDKKMSASVLISATVMWVVFEWLNYHFLTIVCLALVLGMLLQFLWANASGFLNRLLCDHIGISASVT